MLAQIYPLHPVCEKQVASFDFSFFVDYNIHWSYGLLNEGFNFKLLLIARVKTLGTLGIVEALIVMREGPGPGALEQICCQTVGMLLIVMKEELPLVAGPGISVLVEEEVQVWVVLPGDGLEAVRWRRL